MIVKLHGIARKEAWKMTMTSCEACECYCCLVNLDEDEMYKFLSGTQRACPYFRLDDEYAVVRKQI